MGGGGRGGGQRPHVAGPTLRGRLHASWRALRSVVGHPQLRKAELAFFLSCATDAAGTVVLGVVAFAEGGVAGVGLIGVARMLPSAIGTPFVATLADRHRRERVLVAASVVRGIVLLSIAAMVRMDGPIALLYVLAVPATLAATMFRPAHSALLPSLCTGAPQLTSANVLRGSLESLATFCGPALVGVLLAGAGAAAALVATALLSLSAAGALLGIRYESPVPASTRARPRVRAEAVEGLRSVATNPGLRLVFGLGFAQTFVRGALNVFVIVVAAERLGTGDPGAARLYAAVGVGGFLGSVGVSVVVGGRRLARLLTVALVLWGTPIAVLAVVERELLTLLLLAVVGLANAVIDVPLFTLPVRLARDEVLARAFGVFESLVALGVAFGSAAAPVLIALLGLPGALVAVGLVLPLLALATVRRVAELDRHLGGRDLLIASLRRTPIFELLPVPMIEQLASSLDRRVVPAGTALFREGDVGRAFYLVAAGRAEVVVAGRVVSTLVEGDFFGEIALLRDVPRTAGVRAGSDLTVLEITRQDFLAACAYRSSAEAASSVATGRLAEDRRRRPAPAPGRGVGGGSSRRRARRAVLAAAVELAAESGAVAVDVEASAARAGVDMSEVSRSFDDGIALRTAVAAEGFALLAQALSDTHDLRDVAATFARFARDHRGHAEVMLRPALLHEPDAALCSARALVVAHLGRAAHAVGTADATPVLDAFATLLLAAPPDGHGAPGRRSVVPQAEGPPVRPA